MLKYPFGRVTDEGRIKSKAALTVSAVPHGLMMVDKSDLISLLDPSRSF